MKTKLNPDFIIIGAPKSGTTSLFHYLNSHEDIFFPPGKKEPCFFCDYKPGFTGPGSDAFNKNMITDADDYKSLFKDAHDSAVTGEASTDYFSCPAAVKNIYQWNPDVKLIVLLRNPVERAFSEHMHLVRDCYETETFKRSLELEEKRRQAGFMPLFWHTGRGNYAQSIKRYQETFPPENIKIIFFEEYKNNTQEIVNELFLFLGVDAIPVNVNKRYNFSGTPKNRLLQKMFVRYKKIETESFVSKGIRVLTTQKIRHKLKDIFLNRNIAPNEIENQDLRCAVKLFDSEIDALSSLLGKNLDHWKLI